MAWPTPSEYQDAIQNPRACFTDPELQAGAPALTPMGIPRPFSGGHASVYRINSDGRTWAVRCFLRNLPDQQRRYEAVDRYLRSTALACKVNFEYQPEGIRIGASHYPVVKMEWVEGTPLNRHVESLLEDRAALRRLAGEWRALIRSLEAADVAHGDLYHENVLVTDGATFRLIDYDGVYVPALAGQTGHEVGHPSYQHPRRSPSDFGPRMDRFSAFAIHLALVALSYEPALWAQFNNDDNLLFGRDDFLNPATSRLFAALQRLGEPVATRALMLQAACAAAPSDAPDIDDAGETPALVETLTVERPASPPVVRTRRAPRASANLPSWLLDHIALEDAGEEADEVEASEAETQSLATRDPVAASGERVALVAHAPFVFSFAQAWQRPGEQIVPVMRQQPVFQEETRLSTKTEVVHNTEVAVFAYLALQVLVLVTLPGMVVMTLLAGLFIFQLVRRTREVEFWEPYQKQIGTRPVEELTTKQLRGHREVVSSVAFSQDGHQLATASDDGYAFVWETETGERLAGLGPHEQRVSGVTAVGAAHFATCAWDQQVRVWHHRGRLEKSLSLADVRSRFYGVAASADGALIAGAIGQRQVRVWDARTGAEVATLRGHGRKVQSLAFLPEGKRIVSCSSDMSVRVWNVSTERCERVLYGHTDEVNVVCVSADGELIASGGSDCAIFVWSARTGKQLLRINARTRVYGLAFSPHGGFLISAGEDALVRCWDVTTGQEAGHLIGHKGIVRSVAVSPDGRHIASCGDDGRVILWTRIDATTRRALAPASSTSQASATALAATAPRKSLDVAPTGERLCPRCGKPLRVVQVGIPFWGCTDFPACPYAVKM
jgi:hypothetical protein